MSAALQLAIQLADEIEQFPLGNCGPSDDPDKQYAFCAGFRDVAIRFIGAVKRIGDPDLSSLVAKLDTSFEYISEAHELRASLYVAIDALREAMQVPSYEATAAANGAFLSPEVLLKLKALSAQRLDPAKLVRICEELNEAYASRPSLGASMKTHDRSRIYTHTCLCAATSNCQRKINLSRIRRPLKSSFKRSSLNSQRPNKPLEWTGLYKLSAPPPQAHCLPLRGSVRRIDKSGQAQLCKCTIFISFR